MILQEEDHDGNAFQENCEQCGHLMPERAKTSVRGFRL